MTNLVLACQHVDAASAIGPSEGSQRVALDLCVDARSMRTTLKSQKATCLVLALCREPVSLAELQAEATRAGLDPLGLDIVNLAGMSDNRARRLLAAAVARADAYTGSRPEHWKARFAKQVSRRSVFRGSLYEYHAAPAVEAAHCAVAKGCRLCIDACPTGAIKVEDGRIVHDVSKCEPCGRCVTACPTGATLNPRYHPQAIEAGVRALLQSPDGEMGIVFVCDSASADGPGPRWYPIRLPCASMAPPAWLLAPLLMGASRVAAGACGPRCPADGPAKTEANIKSAQRMLATIGLTPTLSSTLVQAPPEPGPCLLSPRNVEAPFRHDSAPRIFAALCDATGRTVDIDDENLRVGIVRVTDACTVCGSCAAACPTDALQTASADGHAELSFNPAVCVSCARCTAACPEANAGAIRLLPGFHEAEAVKPRTTVRTSGVLACRRCGSPIAPTAMVQRVLALISPVGTEAPSWATLCMECRGQTDARLHALSSQNL